VQSGATCQQLESLEKNGNTPPEEHLGWLTPPASRPHTRENK